MAEPKPFDETIGPREIGDRIMQMLGEINPDPVNAITGVLSVAASLHVSLGGDLRGVEKLSAGLRLMVRRCVGEPVGDEGARH